MDRVGMDESHLEAEHPVPRRLVDQLGTGVGQVREGSAYVVDLVRDVVHSRAALREEAADGRVVPESAQQLEPTRADADRRSLHALFLDSRAMLEPGAEEALVRVERAVEILDGKTDMVHRAGRLRERLHRAIVCERLAATMRASALALALTAALLAGCGGHSNTAKPNGEAAKPADRVLADADAAATSASSVHVSGTVSSNGTPIVLNLSLTHSKGAKGSMSVGGQKFDLIRIGDMLYIKGSDSFYQQFGGAAAAQLLHGKWLKGSATKSRLSSLVPLTNIDTLFAKIATGHGKLTNDGKKTYKGQAVVQLRDTSDGSNLLVAATGKPYPVAITGGKKSQSGTIAFGDWNKSVPLSAPSNAIDLSKLGG